MTTEVEPILSFEDGEEKGSVDIMLKIPVEKRDIVSSLPDLLASRIDERGFLMVKNLVSTRKVQENLEKSLLETSKKGCTGILVFRYPDYIKEYTIKNGSLERVVYI